MKKVIIIFFSLISLTGAILIYFSFKYKANSLDEDILTINKAYFYNENTPLNVNFYSSSKESLLLDIKGLEAYLNDKKDNRFKVEIKEVNLDNYATYNNHIYYRYNVKIYLNASNIFLEEANLEVITVDKIIKFYIGNIYYYASKGIKRLGGVSELYGLSFNNPFSSTAGVIIRLNGDLKIKKVSIPNSFDLGLKEINDYKEDTNQISSYLNYQYKNNYSDIIDFKKDKYYLMLLHYDEDILYDAFPILIETDSDKYLIDNFRFIAINDLDLIAKLVKVNKWN